MSRPFLPYGRQQIDESDIAAVVEVLRSDWLTTGPRIETLESALARRVSARHAIVCSSGTAALHLACLAAGLGPGDAAIVPSITFLATANAVRMTGAEVVFADVDGDTGLMEASQLRDALARAETAGLRVKAALVVDLAGQCPDLEAIAALARDRGVIVIEDACHALGSTYRDSSGKEHPIGSGQLAQMTVFSFHPVKTIAAGEGGAVVTNDGALAQHMRDLRSHGMTRDPARFEVAGRAFDLRGAANPWYYEMDELGWNYRLSDIHAALALSQLGRLDDFIAARRVLVDCYKKQLAPMHNLVSPIPHRQACTAAWHLFPVLIDFWKLELDRASVMTRLREAGIGTMVHYIPVHQQPYYSKRYGPLALPGAERYYGRTLSLPLFVGMTEDDINDVVAALGDALKGGTKTPVKLTPLRGAGRLPVVDRKPSSAPSNVMKVGMK
jgi:UDP-4-amino-4,6-dideoxy-N-acetyl-beta-L-altrosamine transaminase